MLHRCECGKWTLGNYHTRDCWKCWDKKHTFTYKQKVFVADGFYKGRKGIVLEDICWCGTSRGYRVKMGDITDGIWKGHLKCIESK